MNTGNWEVVRPPDRRSNALDIEFASCKYNVHICLYQSQPGLKYNRMYGIMLCIQLMTLPGYCWAEEEKRTHRPVSKFADRHVELARQRSMQSVSMRVPGLESRMSSGAVNTFPVTSSVCVESPGAEQNWVMAGDRRVEISTGEKCYQACHGIIISVYRSCLGTC